MSEPGTYTASDIERYHQGEMPPAEMHLLEKAAHDDPVLADMLEGYRFTTTASADLQSLQEKLQRRIGNTQEKKAAVIRLQWLKIAAVFILLAGGGWLVFQTFSTNHNKLARQNTVQEKSAASAGNDSLPATASTTAPGLKADSLPQANDVAVNTTALRKKQDFVNGHPRRLPHNAKNQAATKQETGNAASISSIAKADVQASDSTAAVASVNARRAAPPAAPSGDTARHLDIVLKPLDQSLSEVIVTTAKPKKLRRNEPTVLIDTLEPEQGWQSFDDYVAEKLKVPDEVKEKRVAEGDVELSFSVDKEGTPVHIKVTKPLCEKCDAEAVRLLKEGPKWKGKKGKVKIRFPLSP